MEDLACEILSDYSPAEYLTVGIEEDVEADFIAIEAELISFSEDESEEEALPVSDAPKIHAVKAPDGRVMREFSDPADAYLYAKGLRAACTIHKKVRAFHVKDTFGHYFGDADDFADAEQQLAALGRPGTVIVTPPGMTLLLQSFKKV